MNFARKSYVRKSLENIWNIARLNLKTQTSFPGSLFEPRQLLERPWERGCWKLLPIVSVFNPLPSSTFWAESISKTYFSTSYLERNNGELIIVIVKAKKIPFHHTRILPLLFAVSQNVSISQMLVHLIATTVFFFFYGKVLNCKTALIMDVSGHLCQNITFQNTSLNLIFAYVTDQ